MSCVSVETRFHANIEILANIFPCLSGNFSYIKPQTHWSKSECGPSVTPTILPPFYRRFFTTFFAQNPNWRGHTAKNDLFGQSDNATTFTKTPVGYSSKQCDHANWDREQKKKRGKKKKNGGKMVGVTEA